MIFVERHILAEYLHEHHEVELALHAAAAENGCAPTDDLLPARWESTEMRARRESFNQVRRGSPLLQQLQQEPLATIDNRGHRLEWTGAVVGHIHDLHYAGYVTQCCVPLLRAALPSTKRRPPTTSARSSPRSARFREGTCNATWTQRAGPKGWRRNSGGTLLCTDWTSGGPPDLPLPRHRRVTTSLVMRWAWYNTSPIKDGLKKGPVASDGPRRLREGGLGGDLPRLRLPALPRAPLRPGIWRRLQRENPGSLGPVRAAQTPRGPNLGPKHGRRLAGLLLVNAKEKGMGLDHLPLLLDPQICLPRSRSTQRLTRGCLPLECGMLTIQWENTCYILTPWPTLGTPSWTTANKTAWS